MAEQQAILSAVEKSIINNVRKGEYLDKKYDFVLFTGREMQIILFEMEKRYRRAMKQFNKDEKEKNGFGIESQRRITEISVIIDKISKAEIKRGAGYQV